LVKLTQRSLENSETNAVDFVEDFKMNLYSKEIFVFTPKGEIKSLPKAHDFCFSIHSEELEPEEHALMENWFL
jgi:GTP pyrophosphokinase